MIHRVWISNRIHCMKIPNLLIWIHITMAVSKIPVGNAATCHSRCDCKNDGTIVDVCIGEDENDPVFCVTDLLIHLAGENMEKKANKVIEGEALDILVGSRPLKGAEKEAVSKQILSILKEKYDMEEEDFLSAELEVVPAGKSRESGLDASMIMAYGQDDRVCAYTSLVAMLEVEIRNTQPAACL